MRYLICIQREFKDQLDPLFSLSFTLSLSHSLTLSLSHSLTLSLSHSLTLSLSHSLTLSLSHSLTLSLSHSLTLSLSHSLTLFSLFHSLTLYSLSLFSLIGGLRDSHFSFFRAVHILLSRNRPRRDERRNLTS